MMAEHKPIKTCPMCGATLKDEGSTRYTCVPCNAVLSISVFFYPGGKGK